ncbi:hypothetical protein ARMGADRAFT_1039862 [Armillaria gallica]|uniref:Uncharacterized protein n=1 Tax=Armillaria gallica TaxID=47427 RepID=A0A2H3CQL0_ARMGA|nr:hypothetical protein ARMGADRAFT_1039862 [Armillaria gallica]
MTLRSAKIVLIASKEYALVHNVDFWAAHELEEVTVMCEQEMLGNVVHWLKTAESDQLLAIDVSVIIHHHNLNLDALTRLDKDFKVQPCKAFKMFGLHRVPMHAFAATSRSSMVMYKEEVFNLGSLTLPHFYSCDKYSFYWSFKGKGGLNEHFKEKPVQLQISCASGTSWFLHGFAVPEDIYFYIIILHRLGPINYMFWVQDIKKNNG